MLLSLEIKRLWLVLLLNVSVQHEMLAPYRQTLQVISAPLPERRYERIVWSTDDHNHQSQTFRRTSTNTQCWAVTGWSNHSISIKFHILLFWKNFGHKSFLLGHWYPCFGHLDVFSGFQSQWAALFALFFSWFLPSISALPFSQVFTTIKQIQYRDQSRHVQD